jgi:putative methionine-R-sulfoxide reductase with GAF domain
MDPSSILDDNAVAVSGRAPIRESAAAERLPTGEALFDALRFPGEDGGRSLTEMAKLDLEATLQLLAERAQSITGASGAAIGLRQGEQMVCRASAGPAAPKLGARFEVSSGLSGECVRTRQILLCHDLATDPRVNREICLALGIVSALVMPLPRDGEVIGVFELLSGKPHAFEERDIAALERLGEMVQTALDHSDAARRAERVISLGEAGLQDDAYVAPPPVPNTAGSPLPTPAAVPTPVEERGNLETPPVDRGQIGQCIACGFPVSGGRALCVDCEASRPGHVSLAPDPSTARAPAFFSGLLSPAAPEEGWLKSHKYLIGTVLITAATLATLLWLR